MTLRLEPYTFCMLAGFIPGIREGGQIPAWLYEAGAEGSVTAVTKDGRMLGVFALIQTEDDGVCEMLACFSEELRRTPVALHKLAKTYLPLVVERLGTPDVIAYADTDDPEGQLWLERLGFTALAFTDHLICYQWLLKNG